MRWMTSNFVIKVPQKKKKIEEFFTQNDDVVYIIILTNDWRTFEMFLISKDIFSTIETLLPICTCFFQIQQQTKPFYESTHGWKTWKEIIQINKQCWVMLTLYHYAILFNDSLKISFSKWPSVQFYST